MPAAVNGDIVQICFIVEDLDAAMKHWTETVGAGPFFAQRDLKVPVEYRGTPAFLDIHVGLGQAGTIQIELIEIISTAPSVYTDMFPEPKSSGFHHVAVFVKDIEKEIAAMVADGHSMGARGDFAGTPFAYMDTRSTVGIFTELYQDDEGMRSFYRKIADAAKDWDRSDPVRPLADVL